jgi:SPP1 family predicted phage head-tail adaptor
MGIGQKNRRVEIWQRTGAVDSANDPLLDAWALHKTKWAKIKGETGMGAIRGADGINTPLDRYSFEINYDTSITVGMQLRERDGSRHNIIAVRHDKARRNWTHIVTEIGGSNG